MISLKYRWHWIASVVLLVLIDSNNFVSGMKSVSIQFQRPGPNFNQGPKSNLDRLESKVKEIEDNVNKLKDTLFAGNDTEEDLKKKQELLKLEVEDLGQAFSAITDGNKDTIEEISIKIGELNTTIDSIQSTLFNRTEDLEKNDAKRRHLQAQELDKAITHRSYDLARVKLALINDDRQLKQILTRNFKKSKNIDNILYLAGTIKTNATRMALIYRIMQRVVLDHSNDKMCDQIKIMDKLKKTLIDSQLNVTVLHINVPKLLAKFQKDLLYTFKQKWLKEYPEAVVTSHDYLQFTMISDIRIKIEQKFKLERIDKDRISCRGSYSFGQPPRYY